MLAIPVTTTLWPVVGVVVEAVIDGVQLEVAAPALPVVAPTPPTRRPIEAATIPALPLEAAR